ncbi:hypothetical protein QFC22_000412 [Naganishia vaughanmartiniae]|uniref:Uncharacterized protein n=1 Tax=Naganishia vaughanmartiniae TaxID=1424756 RepID=A0ACC2XP85_9TREE|nr:hypothetical protein QFC22_000412 [Naganishia vaughanmartiniae]
MTPVNSYNSQCNYEELVDGVGNNKNLGVTDECLLLFGNGDGGGGPTPRMLSKLERISALATENPEVPNVKIGKPSEFFDSIAAKTRHGRDLATWRGELYFELHRGTYTSQADIKRGNRFMEKALRDLEYYGTLASLHDSSYKYPKAELDAAWKDTMLGQFHDVLPGTSIRKAIDDTLEMYEQQLAITAPLIQQALNVILPSAPTNNGHAEAAKNRTHIAAADPVRLHRCEVVSMDQSLASVAHLSRVQPHSSGAFALLCTDESGNNQIVDSPEGIRAPKAYQDGDAYIVENAHFRLTISNGRIISLIDLIDSRELILAGSSAETGGLITYDDFPLAYDAWDAEIYHLDCSHVIDFDEVKIQDNGPLRASLLATAKFGDSTVAMTFSLDAVMPDVEPSVRSWIRVETSVDWHETHTFLKCNTAAIYDTQYGLIDRPTHRNTTVDQAKFEVVAHRFADLSETGYGIALVADHKYGYAVEGNVMRLSLLRSSTAPDPLQDMGHHDFSFAIMPHTGRLVESSIPQDALRFTNPPILRAVASTESSLLAKSKITISGPRSRGIVLDAIKRGEDDVFDGSGSEKIIILRLYEGLGGRARGRLTFAGVRAKEVSYVNILEEDMPGTERDVKWSSEDGTLVVDLDVRGFEIKTLKVLVE